MIPKVSVIVPVHNAGEYLRICLDSLTGQTLHEIEILLILDKPTDGSDKIAEEYAANDCRIKLIYNSENLHTGFSRNEGIKAAKGEFIGFADHDDYCEPEMYQKLYESAILEQADVVISNFYDETPFSKSYFAFPTGYSTFEFQQRAFLSLISADYSIRNSESFNNMNVVWNQIYRRLFIIEQGIFFPDNRIYTMEDVFFSIKVYHLARKVFYLPEIYYHHVNTNSNNYVNYSYQSYSRIIPLIENIYSFLKQHKIENKYRKEFSLFTLKRLYSSFRNEIKFKQFKTTVNFFKAIRNNNPIQEILSSIGSGEIKRKLSITKRTFLFLIHK